MRATWADAATGLLEVGRVAAMLARIKDHIVHRRLAGISPLALPAMLQIGRETVAGGEADEHVLREAAEDLIREAMGNADDA
jgi:ATP-dependent Lhr-like helicase